MTLEIIEVDEFQRGDVGGFKVDGWRDTGIEGFLPAQHTQAPLVAGLEAGEVIFWVRRDQVIAHHLGENQKILGHAGTHGVNADIICAGVAAAIAEEAGERVIAAIFQLSAQYIACHRAIVPCQRELSGKSNRDTAKVIFDAIRVRIPSAGALRTCAAC